MAGPHEPPGGQGPRAERVVAAPSLPESRPAWYRLHLWEIQPVRDILLVAIVIGVIYLGYVARVVITPMLLALLLAYLCEPLVRFIRRKVRVSRRVVALAIIVAAFFMVIVPVTLATGFAAIQAAKAVGSLTENVSRVRASVAAPDDASLRENVPRGSWRSIRDFVVKAGKSRKPAATGAAPGTAPSPDGVPPPDTPRETSDTHSLASLVLGWLEEHGTELGRGLLGGGAEAVAAAVTTTVGIGFLIFSALLTAIFFFFFSSSWEGVLAWFAQLIPLDRRERAQHLLARMDRVIAGFVRGRLLIACILGVYLTFIYFIAGVPAWLILGPLIGLCFIVPMGQVIGLPIAMLLMWLDQGTGNGIEGTSAHWAFQRTWWWIVFSPFAINASAQVVDDYILTPRIQGKTTDLSIPMILFASLAGGAIGGLYGLLVAIPVAACLKILAEETLWPRVRAWVRGQATDILPIGKQ